MTKIPDATSVSAGDPAGFTVSLTNSGSGNAYYVTASDPLPGGTTWSISPASAGWSISGNVLTYGPATLAGGASTSVQIGRASCRAGGYIPHNAATFTTTNDGSGGAQADVAVNCGEVSMTKIPDATSVSAGDHAGFTVCLINTGTDNACVLSPSDPLPGGTTWSISPASAGWSISGNVLTYGPATLAGGASTSV